MDDDDIQQESSDNGATEYLLEDATVLTKNNDMQNRREKKLWCSIASLMTGLIAAIAIVSVCRAIHEAIERPVIKPVFPRSYEASLTLHMPYSNLSEPIFVHADTDAGYQRLSYYGGMDTYILSRNSSSYQIVPVIHDLKCFTSGSVPSLQQVFPNLTSFESISGVHFIRGRMCYGWSTSVKSSVKGGLLGTYTLYVDKVSNAPVRFHYIGHNVMLGGSHVDEYYIEYEYIREGGPVPKAMFTTLPSVMNCSASTSSNKNQQHILSSFFPQHHEEHSTRTFSSFVSQYEKVYDDDLKLQQAWTNFHHNRRYVDSMNRRGNSYRLRLNHFADLDIINNKKIVRMKRESNNHATKLHTTASKTSLPQSIDWREKGAVTVVKDQGMCGSCWAFGTTGAIEGAMYVKTNYSTPLSQQNLMDCSWEEGNNGCDGGLDYQAYRYVMKAGGLEASSTYGSYRNVDGFCHFDPTRAVVMLTGFVNVSSNFESFNDALVTRGPLSVSIDATRPSFYFYEGGLYDDVSCKSGVDDLDHSVLAVGYGETTSGTQKKYTIIRNSWSTHWGEEGYVRVAQEGNVCGVSTAATYPLVIA